MMTIIEQIIAQSKKISGKRPVLVKDTVVSYQTYAIGDGEWSIEAKTTHDQSVWGPSIKQWSGSNGSRSIVGADGYLVNEEPDDLWAEVAEWENDPKGGLAVDHWEPSLWMLPDGASMSLKQAQREVLRGNLHGLLIGF